ASVLVTSPEHPSQDAADPFADLELKCECRCGARCRSLIIEADLQDAEREPRIAERGSPLWVPARSTESGETEVEGYLLKGEEGGARVFLDEGSNWCTIYETRPLACRLFDCDGEGRQQLIDLGVVTRGDGVGPDR